ncbi:hypothetical protein PILCRDRAFT_91813 [Piloderma croceum F 1598]|uniref:Uncharacterized protein n=1 Tax=Piloderma croceum (strain F 1598) TaxID=765440 RepID=A0A0C3EU91_PILCF|nr:hypothetical protein PILCRDRAFT_91813 [Piloderma croceum F 1598]
MSIVLGPEEAARVQGSWLGSRAFTIGGSITVCIRAYFAHFGFDIGSRGPRSSNVICTACSVATSIRWILFRAWGGYCRFRWLYAGRRFSGSNADDYDYYNHRRYPPYAQERPDVFPQYDFHLIDDQVLAFKPPVLLQAHARIIASSGGQQLGAAQYVVREILTANAEKTVAAVTGDI